MPFGESLSAPSLPGFQPLASKPFAGQPITGFGTPQKKERLAWFDMDDLLAPIRGVEGAVRSIADITLDPIFGTNFGDQPNVTGESDTIIGGMLEGITQFAVPYLGAGRLLGLAGRALPAVRSSLASQLAGRQVLARTSTAAAKGAVADFLAFQGDEARLSDWINQIAPNALTEFLASDSDDSEALGRVKNVLEGAGIGVAFDLVFAMAKKIKAGNKALEKGALPEEAAAAAEKAAQEAGIEGAAAKATEKYARQRRADFNAARELDEDPFGDPQEFVDFAERQHSKKGVQEPQKAEDGKEVFEESNTGPEVIPEVNKELEAAGLSSREAERAEKIRRAHEADRLTQQLTDKAEKNASLRQQIRAGETDITLDQAVSRGIKDLSPWIQEWWPQLKNKNLVEEGVRLFDEAVINGDEFLHIRYGFGRKGREAISNLSDDAKAFLGFARHRSSTLANIADDNTDVLAMIQGMANWLENNGVTLQKGSKSEADIVLQARALAGDVVGGTEADVARFMSAAAKDSDSWAATVTATGMLLVDSAGKVSKMARLFQKGLDNASPAELVDAGIAEASLKGEDAVTAVFETEFRKFAMVRDGIDTVAGASGRALRANRIPLMSNIMDLTASVDNISQAKEILGTKEFERRMAAIAAAARNPDELAALASLAKLKDMSRHELFRLYTTDWVINNILWAPKTVMTNFIFPAVHAVYRPLENIMGGTLRGLKTGEWDAVTHEWIALQNAPVSMAEAWKAFKLSMKEGAQFDPRNTIRDDPARNLISSRTLSELAGDRWGPDQMLGRAIDFIGKAHGYAGKLMESSDEAIKVFVARSQARAYLVKEAMSKEVADPTAHVVENMNRMFENGQMMSEKGLAKKVQQRMADEGLSNPVAAAQRERELYKEVRDELRFDDLYPVTQTILDRARDITATTPLEKGSFSHRVQTFIDQTPYGRLIVPFIRTPANLFRQAFQRSAVPDMLGVGKHMVTAGIDKMPFPPGLAKAFPQHKSLEQARLRNLREFMSEDPMVASAALGRMSTAVITASSVIAFAAQGRLTGAGPTDKEQRRLLLDAGWQPYSIQLEKGVYAQYLKADPFALMMGFWADLVETSHVLIADEGNDQFAAITQGLFVSMANNMADRSYMAGVQQFLDAASDPLRFGPKFIAQRAGGFVPRGLTEAFRGATRDPVLEEVHTLYDEFKRTLPYFGELPPVRNMFGEPIRRSNLYDSEKENPSQYLADIFLPVAYREVNDPLRHELASLQHGFSPPSKKKYGLFIPRFKNEKGQDAYDRWTQLQGEVKVGGKSIRQAMRKEVRTRRYQRLPAGATLHDESPRVRALKNIRDEYREKAWEQTLREYPDLAREISIRQTDQARLRAGMPTKTRIQGVPGPFGAFLAKSTQDPEFGGGL